MVEVDPILEAARFRSNAFQHLLKTQHHSSPGLETAIHGKDCFDIDGRIHIRYPRDPYCSSPSSIRLIRQTNYRTLKEEYCVPEWITRSGQVPVDGPYFVSIEQQVGSTDVVVVEAPAESTGIAPTSRVVG